MPVYENNTDQAEKVKVDPESAHFKTVQPGETVQLNEEHGSNLGWKQIKDAETNEQVEDDTEDERPEGETGAQDTGQNDAEGGTGEDEGNEAAEEESGQKESGEVEESDEFESWSEVFQDSNVDDSTEAVDQALQQADEGAKQPLLQDALEAEENGENRKSVKDYINSKIRELEAEEE